MAGQDPWRYDFFARPVARRIDLVLDIYSRAISGGKWGSKHFIMWQGSIPGEDRDKGWCFDSLPGKIRDFNPSRPIITGKIFRVTRVNDPWYNKE